MTERKKPRRFAHQLLGMIGISALAAGSLMVLLTALARGLAEEYCFNHDIAMTEFDWMALDRWIVTVGGITALVVFSALFLMLLARHMAYIRTVTRGIDALGRDEADSLPLEGSNELTALAEAVNEMSRRQRQLRQQEAALAAEREQFVRSLSHDIRTPLTAILGYSEYLTEHPLPPEKQQEYLGLIRQKAVQIRDLTTLLLDGDRRNLEEFEDLRVLLRQLAAEFEEELEDVFRLTVDLSQCLAAPGRVDVQDLRRIFDNLRSNIQKYADPAQPVLLQLRAWEGGMALIQRNTVRENTANADSHGLGLQGIRRIAGHYGGQVTVHREEQQFGIEITLNTGAG